LANRGTVSNRPHRDGCVSLPQISLAGGSWLAYQATVSTANPTKESHMTNPLCAFARGVAVATWGMHRA